MRHALAATVLVTGATFACADAPPADEAPPEEPAAEAAQETPDVTILEPAEGAEIEGPSVTVRLGVENLQIALAGDMTEGTGHHHLYLDADLTSVDEPIPSVEGSIVHMGDGSSEFTFENVEPGAHRIIAVVGDGLHVPLQPLVVDTVNFVVR